MKIRTVIPFVVLLIAAPIAFAEGKADHDWGEKAARGYEEKAAMAAKKGNSEHARIYKKMAEMKRDAAKASAEGKKYDWSEYHKLQAKLNPDKYGKKAKYDKDAKQMKSEKQAKSEKKEKYSKKEKYEKEAK